jgi:hypothetical protein
MAAITAITGLRNLPNLQELRLEGGNNGCETIDVSGLTNLTYLDVSDMDIPDTSDPSLKYLNVDGCTSLTTIYMDDSDFSEGFPDLSSVAGTLEYFDADQCGITGSLNLSGFPALKGFDLNGNTGLTSVTISSSQPLGGGREIYFDGCALTETAVDNILVALSENGITGGYVDLSGGTNAIPGATGDSALEVLGENGWNWDVNTAPPGYVGIAASTDFDITGDFTIEMFVRFDSLIGNQRPYSFGTYPAANAISFEGDGASLYFWANNASPVSGSTSLTTGTWYHVCVMGSGSDLYLFLDGVSIGTGVYSGSISSQSLPLTIGYGNEANSEFKGLMSNFRWTESAVYTTTGFTVPVAPLTDLANTVLLTFQGNDLNALLLDNSGNGHNATNEGATFSAEDPFASAAGSLQMGVV